MTDIYNPQQLQPLYMRVAEDLKQAVDKGTYAAGSKLPSESQLVNDLGVSRVTVRKALQQLNDMGYTYSEKGKGTFVKATKLRHDFLSMSGFSQEAVGAGFEAQNKVSHFEVIQADAEIAEKLRVKQGEAVNFAGRLRLINGEVVSYEEFYIPRALLPNLEQVDLEGSKFEYLSRNSIEMVKTHQTLIPALAEPRIQALLCVEEHEPILINRSLNFSSEEEIYEYSVVYYKSSLYDFEITARV